MQKSRVHLEEWLSRKAQMPGAAVLVLLIVGLQSVYCTPLDDYINKPDSSYKFEDLGSPDKEDGYTTYYINMTSQTWLSCKYLYFYTYIIIFWYS